MGIGACEIFMEEVIREELELLRAKPWRLEYLFNIYREVPSVTKRLGKDFIGHAMDLVTNTELTIQPYYTPNVDNYPCLIITASYDEGEQYLGDYGTQGAGRELEVENAPEIQPVVYAKFDAKSVSGKSVYVSHESNIQDRIYRNIWISNGTVHGKVTRIIVRPGKDTQLVTDTEFPTSGVRLSDWTAGTPLTPKNVEIHGSHDSVTVTMQLLTSGNPEVHRIWSQIVYQCLKRGRQRLDDYGMQTFKFTRSSPTVHDDSSMIMSTSFSGSGVQLDTWIWNETDPLYRIDIKSRAVPTQPDEEIVDL